MNEEIDVSKCAFYSKGKCNNPNGMACNCRNTAICYFKELKRLELENKKLKELLETRCYNEVEFENKKLKEALEKIKSFFNPEYNDYQTNTIKKMMKDIIEEALGNE